MMQNKLIQNEGINMSEFLSEEAFKSSLDRKKSKILDGVELIIKNALYPEYLTYPEKEKLMILQSEISKKPKNPHPFKSFEQWLAEQEQSENNGGQ